MKVRWTSTGIKRKVPVEDKSTDGDDNNDSYNHRRKKVKSASEDVRCTPARRQRGSSGSKKKQVFTMGKDRLDEPLDLHNYSTWKLRFQLLCAELGYSRALLQAPIAEADVIISDKVKSVMAKNVRNHHLQTIVRAANAKAAWDALAATFSSTCNTRKVALRQELSDFKMDFFTIR
ncbi:hypothetical protein VaNZ11_010117 [Volvox africanus]|uniref:DUF4219 domain-containing protein n=1 Tax=Volvox africanus TaxID=51714 RepID=A0ABQ5S8U8_9CHLO|nr:hypothetical protein VaNZ11_010117 [Volvox africanus]